MSWDWLAAGHVTTVLTSDWSAARDSLGLILTLDTIADTNTTLNLSPAAVSWFKHARFDVKTVTDVVNNMENGIKHVIQVGYKYLLLAPSSLHCMVRGSILASMDKCYNGSFEFVRDNSRWLVAGVGGAKTAGYM